MGLLSRDTAINIVAWGVKKAIYQFVWLTQTCTKKWFPVHEFKIPGQILWFSPQKRIQRLRKSGTVE